MTDSHDLYRALMAQREDLAEIKDDELDRIRERAKADLIKVLRTAIDDINRLPDQGSACEARRKAEIEWFGEILRTLGAPQ